MIGHASRTVRLLGAVTVLTVMGGCQNTQQRAREQAAQRWNAARAQVKAQLAADQFEGGNIASAAGELAEAYRLDPDNPDFIPLRARLWLAEGKIMAAEELLEQTCLEGPAHAEIEYLLGVARQQQQRWAEALDAFLRAVEIDADEVAYVVAVTQAWMQLGQPREALAFLTGMSPRIGWTNAYQAALAECHEQLGQWSAAASAWQRVVFAQGADVRIRERLAEALYRSRRYIEAIPVFVELFEEEEGGSSGILRLMLAECYLAEGRSTAAREQVQIVLRQEPDNVHALGLLARSLAAAGEYSSALRVARRALAADAGGAGTLELTAALAWRAGDSELAVSTARRLLELDAGNPVAQRILLQAQIPTSKDTAD